MGMKIVSFRTIVVRENLIDIWQYDSVLGLPFLMQLWNALILEGHMSQPIHVQHVKSEAEKGAARSRGGWQNVSYFIVIISL